ncbi:MAG: hypothetical protein QM811_06865 [Pirellulales bacterium]
MHLADLLDLHPDHAFGLCFRFWCWCDDHLTTCHASSVTEKRLDIAVGHAGFASALISVGWLRVREGSLEVPNFDRHLSQGSKTRGLAAERKRKERGENVTDLSRSDRDKSVTRSEQSREESLLRNVTSDDPKRSEKCEVGQYTGFLATKFQGKTLDSRDLQFLSLVGRAVEVGRVPECHVAAALQGCEKPEVKKPIGMFRAALRKNVEAAGSNLEVILDSLKGVKADG